MTQWNPFSLPGGRALAPQQRLPAPPSRLQQFLVEMGGALVSAGIGVTDAAGTLRQAAIAMGAPGAQLIVLPTALLVSVPGAEGSGGEQVAVATSSREQLRFDQLTALFALADKARVADITPDEGLRELAAIQHLHPRFDWLVRVTGHGAAAAGISLLLQASWSAVLIVFVLGTLVGVWVLISATLVAGRVLAPVVAALVVGIAVFEMAKHGIGGAPLTELVPPLATYIPGSVVTIAVGELAAGDMVAGASRLVYGCFVFAQLAGGIVLADLLVGLPQSQALRVDNAQILGQLTPWLGVLLIGLGFFLLYCGPPGALGWMLLVLLVAYAGQVVGGFFLGGLLSGLVGAVLMTLAAYTLQTVPAAPPAAVLFLPGFWLLIPGAVGLIGLTQVVGTQQATAGSFLSLAGTIFAVSAGVLVGTGLYRMLFRYAPLSWGLHRA